jgi:hypothetical protein
MLSVILPPRDPVTSSLTVAAPDSSKLVPVLAVSWLQLILISPDSHQLLVATSDPATFI